jgi:paraquat-inducible protein A
MVSRASLDRQSVWRAIGGGQPTIDGHQVLSCTTCGLIMPVNAAGSSCPRCHAKLVARKTDSLVRTAALILGAFVLYWPANIYPMNISTQLGEQVQYRIIDGIRDLFQAGLAPFGILIFFTSITIPVLKIAGLGWFVISVVRRSDKHLVMKTRLFRLIDELRRWSNVDPSQSRFSYLLCNLIHSPLPVAHQATAFILVVVFTLLASHSFDPRLMWDVKQARAG